MKALLLAGGFGTRLRPLTLTRPKHLLPIANRPHVDHVLDLLLRHGVDEVVLLTSYLADAFAGVIAAARERGLTVEVTHEPEPLDTAGAIKNAEALVGADTFFVFNGDVLTDVDLGEVMAFHRARSAQATIVLTPVDDPSSYGVVPTDEDGRVEGFIEKPPAEAAPTNLINAGIYVFEPSVLQRIPEGRRWSAERQLFPELVEADAGLYAVATSAYWMDIGTPQKYLDANLDAVAGRLSWENGNAPDDGMVLTAQGTRVHEGATVRMSCLGAGVVVERGATVRDSVLLPGAVVSEGASVLRSILGENARVAAGASVIEATVADGHEVPV
ncbi:MAG TPA: NDP-sugar synthase [Actinomycetota bacterium]|nr:NDP-sugar synthase [Actinomycetota bacterium]